MPVQTRAQRRAAAAHHNQQGTRVVRNGKIYWGLRKKNGRDIQNKRLPKKRKYTQTKQARGCARVHRVPGYYRCVANSAAA